MEGEPDLWYGRFHMWLMQGPERSLSKLFEALEISPRPMREITEPWQWKARAEAYDNYVRQLEREHYETERIKSRKNRIELLDLLYEKVKSALESLPEMEATWRDVVPAVKTVTQELRAEYDDNPKTRLAGVPDEPVLIKEYVGIDLDKV